eukprot:m.35623 g.35623  ORF g.35623 m.35623 type:complete len:521 (-) comp17173_c0_seq1:392-1954(-)
MSKSQTKMFCLRTRQLNANNHGPVLLVLGLLLHPIASQTSAGEGIAKVPFIDNVFTLADDSIAYGLEFRHRSDVSKEKLAAKYESTPVKIATPLGEKYDCYTPNQEHEVSTESVDDVVAQPHPETLLKKLKVQCIYRLEMYWSYEFCYKKHLRQYHEDDVVTSGKKTKKLTEHFLGATSKDVLASEQAPHIIDSPPTWIYRGKETPYYSETMLGGDICDLTGKPRVTEVRFICDPAVIHSFEVISETETCHYLAVVHSSFLCEHSDYTEKGSVPKTMLCVSEAEQTGDSTDVRPQRLAEMTESLEAEEEQRQAELEVIRAAVEEQQAQAQAKAKSNAKAKANLKASTKANANANTLGDEPQQQKQSAVKDRRAREAEQKAGKRLLDKFLSGKECFVGGQGWWVHEFCYMKHVKQVHVEADGSRTEVLLGGWDEVYHRGKMDKLGGQKSSSSVTHYYKDGDYCEDIKGNRKTKVKMICSKSFKGGQIALSLKETKTCSYTMQVESELFCDAIQTADDAGII